MVGLLTQLPTLMTYVAEMHWGTFSKIKLQNNFKIKQWGEKNRQRAIFFNLVNIIAMLTNKTRVVIPVLERILYDL